MRMTLINFDLRAVAATGRVPVDARIRWQPAERRVDGAVVILPEIHSVKLVNGQASADLDPGFYWFTEAHPDGVRALRLVPAQGPVDYAGLGAVDPATLEPTAAPDPAWVAMAESTVTGGEVQGDRLVLRRTDGSTVDAGNVRGPVGPAPALTIGQVVTGAAGSAAAASLTGTPADPVLGLTIPQGGKGDPGGLVMGTVLDTVTSLDAIKTSGVYRQTATPPGALGYPALAPGILVVHERLRDAALQSVIQEYQPVGSVSGVPVTYRRYLFNNATWTAWRAYAAQRVDNTAGRAIYTWDDTSGREQLTYGDTGVRVITSPDVAFQSGVISIRRVGAMVTLALSDLVLPATVTDVPATLDMTNTVPVGFRPAMQPEAINTYGAPTSGTRNRIIVINGTGTVRAYQVTTATGRLCALLTYPTTDTWPTTLPGTASGSIPNT